MYVYKCISTKKYTHLKNELFLSVRASNNQAFTQLQQQQRV